MDPKQDDRIREVLDGRGSVRTYPSGEYLFLSGDPSESVLLVLSGLIRIERGSVDGKTALVELATEGTLVGELGVIDGMPRSASAVTAEESVVRVIPAAEFTELLGGESELAAAVLNRVVRRMRKLTDQFVNVASRNGTERIADRLVEVLDRSGLDDTPGMTLPMPITQAELGQWAGLSREGTTKALLELRADRILETGRRSMVILDPARLRVAAGR